MSKFCWNHTLGSNFLRRLPSSRNDTVPITIDFVADTVIHRIFFGVNRRDNGRICWREFKQSDFYSIMELVDREEDINKVPSRNIQIRQYFSYEHFYVIYCKFWELDGDHDFHITKDDFGKYSSHALSKKVVDRIFA
jgi:serine/threonine-protein phosphatase 2A regulatory subunit B''